MKISSIIFTIAAFLFIFGGAAKSFGQNVPMPGSYMQADAKNADVVKAAEFAVNMQGKKQKATIKLVSVNKAETQVVAGTNYRVCLEVSVQKKSGRTAVKQFVTAIIYRNLQNKYSLTNWTAVAAGSTCESN